MPHVDAWDGDFVARYEELRCQALGEGGGGKGFVLFMRNGMTTWMRALVETALPRGGARPLAEWGGGPAVPVDLHSEVTQVLAGMALCAAAG